ncbi:unnamed protein product [Paramecium octaurelia]|uniref:Uncharacterized protein n=1 Tax=Paramecium octaurelia TaxID=43137 RepID=A0A8S1SIK9_PAROT|nr:unnamed protein product [Paramecium octaurelia]
MQQNQKSFNNIDNKGIEETKLISFQVKFRNKSEIKDIVKSLAFDNSRFLKMIHEINTKGESIELDMTEEEFDNLCHFLAQMNEIFKGQEGKIVNDLEDLKNSEQFKELFKEMTNEKKVLELLSSAEYLDIPNLIILLVAQYSALIKDQRAFINI